MPAEHFIEHGTESKDVGSLVDAIATGLFGAHVVEFSLNRTDLRFGRGAFCLCNAKIDELDFAFFRDANILRIDVAMDDAEWLAVVVGHSVGIRQAGAHFHGNEDGGFDGEDAIEPEEVAR